MNEDLQTWIQASLSNIENPDTTRASPIDVQCRLEKSAERCKRTSGDNRALGSELVLLISAPRN